MISPDRRLSKRNHGERSRGRAHQLEALLIYLRLDEMSVGQLVRQSDGCRSNVIPTQNAIRMIREPCFCGLPTGKNLEIIDVANFFVGVDIEIQTVIDPS
jgi:hypothetical protein